MSASPSVPARRSRRRNAGHGRRGLDRRSYNGLPSASHCAGVERVEVVDAVLAADRVTAAVVGAGGEALLHGLADGDVLELNLVGELDGAADLFLDLRLLGTPEEPFELGQRAAVGQGQDQVG